MTAAMTGQSCSRNFLLVFLTLAAFFHSTAFARRAILLDTGSATTSLDWITHTLNSEDNDESGWLEETYRLTNTSDNKRVYVTCNAGRERGENWLVTPRIERNGAQRISIELTFTIRDCLDFPKSAVKCKDSFELRAKQLRNGERVSNELKPDEWAFVDFVTGERYRKKVTTKQINVKLYGVDMEKDAIQFAFRDQGTCVSLLNVQVFYDVCSAEVRSLVQFPETVSGRGETSFISVVGKCVDNAIPARSVNATALCVSGGRWEMASGQCVCAAGYSMAAEENGCKACPPGTFKSKLDSNVCSLCPAHSTSTSGASVCSCDAGYFRSDEESESHPCTQPPSKPSQLVVTRVLAREVTLQWNEPSNTGGRSDVWYKYQCSNCPRNAKAVPATPVFEDHTLVLTNLEPGTTYSIVIFAENGVSKKAGSAYRQYAVTEFQTKPNTKIVVEGLRLESMSNTGVSISWKPLNSGKDIVTYEVKMSINNMNSSMTTTLSYYSFSSLLAGETYAFSVRGRLPDVGWTEWSDALYYNSLKGQLDERDVRKSGLDRNDFFATPESPLWYAAVVIIIVLLVVLLVFLCVRRPTINRKQLSDLDTLDTYKQDSIKAELSKTSAATGNGPLASIQNALLGKCAPLMCADSAIGATHSCYSNRFKPYVDPTTYEDPNLALTEFANDIDPAFVTITGSIGSGEFGDVCYGRLSLPSHRAIYGDKVQDQIVAIKTLKKGSTEKARADFLMEASIMGQFDHENVVRLIGVVTKTEPTMIIIEYMLNGSLDQYLRRHDDGRLTIDALLHMLKGVACGMRYLSEKGYIHRDLAARNVLVDEQLVCKIADFGLSRGFENSVDQEYTTNGGKIPVRWTAPEAITYRKFSPASDVWSFGILMWEVCSFGERPYWDWTNQKVINEIQLGYRLPPPMDTPPAVHMVMLECWKADRYERPNFSQLVGRLDGLLQRPDLIYDRKVLNQPYAVTPSPMSVRQQYDRSATLSRREVNMGAQQHSQLIEYVSQCGLAHCLPVLVNAGVKSVVDLRHATQAELVSIGLLPEDAATLLRSTLQGRASASPSTWGDSSQTLLSSVSDTRALDGSAITDGFFV